MLDANAHTGFICVWNPDFRAMALYSSHLFVASEALAVLLILPLQTRSRYVSDVWTQQFSSWGLLWDIDAA